MARVKVPILYLALALLLSFPCLAWAWSGMVFGVSDGDTIKVMRAHKEVKVRLYGIDCPERSQAFSKKAKQFSSGMVFGKIVEVLQDGSNPAELAKGWLPRLSAFLPC